MLINAFNKEIINTNAVYIHDSLFSDLVFNYHDNKILFKSIEDVPCGKIYSITFYNVVGFEMIACDFWGKSPHILDWESVDEKKQMLIKKLFDEKSSHHYTSLRLIDDKDYVESIITFTSGDRLTIVCESICFEETPA